MTKVASEDSVRRGLWAMKEEESEPWLKKHLQFTYKPLLEEPWALDVDTTVKPLYGHQDCGIVCAAGAVAVAGWTAEVELSEVSARRLQLGNGAGDGRSRAA